MLVSSIRLCYKKLSDWQRTWNVVELKVKHPKKSEFKLKLSKVINFDMNFLVCWHKFSIYSYFFSAAFCQVGPKNFIFVSNTLKVHFHCSN